MFGVRVGSEQQEYFKSFWKRCFYPCVPVPAGVPTPLSGSDPFLQWISLLLPHFFKKHLLNKITGLLLCFQAQLPICKFTVTLLKVYLFAFVCFFYREPSLCFSIFHVPFSWASRGFSIYLSRQETFLGSLNVIYLETNR